MFINLAIHNNTFNKSTSPVQYSSQGLQHVTKAIHACGDTTRDLSVFYHSTFSLTASAPKITVELHRNHKTSIVCHVWKCNVAPSFVRPVGWVFLWYSDWSWIVGYRVTRVKARVCACSLPCVCLACEVERCHITVALVTIFSQLSLSLSDDLLFKICLNRQTSRRSRRVHVVECPRCPAASLFFFNSQEVVAMTTTVRTCFHNYLLSRVSNFDCIIK